MKTKRILYKVLFLFFTLGISFLAHAQYPQNPHEEPSPEQLQYRQMLIDRICNEDGIEVVQVGDSLKIILGVDKFFQRQSSTRIYAYKEPVLKNDIAQLLRSYGNRRITVSGHTDNVGTDESKFKRSGSQAETIASYLWSGGVPLGNMTILACADIKPVSSNKTVDGSAANRRVEIDLNPAARPRYFK